MVKEILPSATFYVVSWNGDKKETTGILLHDISTTMPFKSSQGYAIPSSFPTNHIHWHQGPPSPGPIISHPSQHHWRTLESSLQVPRIPVPCPCSLRGNPLPAWNTSFHMRLIHFSQSNISILRKHGRHWGSYPIGRCPQSKYPPRI